MLETYTPAQRRGPLAYDAPVSIRVSDTATRFIFRGPPEAARLAGQAFGCALPVEALRANHDGDRAALWLGPDEWLLLGLDAPEVAELSSAIETAAAGVPHSLVDVSHRQVGIDVAGAKAATLLNAGCPLDLDLRAFPVDMSTRTVLAKADITLWRQDEEAFRVEVNRSFSPYCLSFLKASEDGVN